MEEKEIPGKIILNKDDGEWDTCCSKTDKTFVKFIVQVCLGCSVILFSMIQIIRGADNESLYFSLISGTFGVFVPHPTITKSEISVIATSPQREIPPTPQQVISPVHSRASSLTAIPQLLSHAGQLDLRHIQHT